MAYGYGDHYEKFDDFEEALEFALAHRDTRGDVSVHIYGDGAEGGYVRGDRCPVADMIVGRVVGTTEGGWWLLSVPHQPDIALPTFMLPADSRKNDVVRLERVGGDAGFWRVVSIKRPLSSKYGKHHLR